MIRAVVGVLVALAGCAAFSGPLTREYACPVPCGHATCCSYGEECSLTRRACIPAWASAARDAGGDR